MFEGLKCDHLKALPSFCCFFASACLLAGKLGSLYELPLLYLLNLKTRHISEKLVYASSSCAHTASNTIGLSHIKLYHSGYE